MSAIGQLAEELEAPERTLRRAVTEGTIRARRLSPRRLRLANGELGYLRSHWPLLARLREALRTEPSIDVAILAGSMARGDDHARSDIDLVVELRGDEKPLDRQRLAMRLEDRLERGVDVAALRPVLESDPLSLLQILDEGRVIVDRGHVWPELRKQRPAVYRRAIRAYRRQQERTRATLDDLLSD